MSDQVYGIGVTYMGTGDPIYDGAPQRKPRSGQIVGPDIIPSRCSPRMPESKVHRQHRGRARSEFSQTAVCCCATRVSGMVAEPSLTVVFAPGSRVCTVERFLFLYDRIIRLALTHVSHGHRTDCVHPANHPAALICVRVPGPAIAYHEKTRTCAPAIKE